MRLLKHTDINYRYIPTPSNIAKVPDQGLPEKMKLNKPKARDLVRSEEHTSELQSRETISYAVFCLKKKKKLTQVRNEQSNSH